MLRPEAFVNIVMEIRASVPILLADPIVGLFPASFHPLVDDYLKKRELANKYVITFNQPNKRAGTITEF